MHPIFCGGVVGIPKSVKSYIDELKRMKLKGQRLKAAQSSVNRRVLIEIQPRANEIRSEFLRFVARQLRLVS